MEWTMGFLAIILLIIGLIGNAFEMRKIRLSTTAEGELASPNIFLNRNNFKWYAILGVGIVLWYIAERV